VDLEGIRLYARVGALERVGVVCGGRGRVVDGNGRNWGREIIGENIGVVLWLILGPGKEDPDGNRRTGPGDLGFEKGKEKRVGEMDRCCT